MEIKDVIHHLERWAKERRTGSIQVNFFKGGISNINLTQSIKTEKEGECENGKRIFKEENRF